MADEFDRYFDKMNTINQNSAKAQMDFQERMSSSAHVREVQDLIKAGLNPILSANNGASSPQGAYANVDNSAISAKFARQNLEKELANQRTIALMNNENSYRIAQAQIAANYALGVYQSDNAKEASIYGSDMQKVIAEMNINNPSSLPAIVSKFVSSFLGDDSIANTAKEIGDKGLFGAAYDVAKRLFDQNNGYSMSARRVADIQRRVNQEKSILAQATQLGNSVFKQTGSKAKAREAKQKYLRDHNYYKLVGKNIFQTLI